MAAFSDVVTPDLPLAEYRRPWLDGLIVSILLIMLGAVIIWLALRQSPADLFVVAGGVALALLFLGVAMYKLLRTRHRRLQIFEQGLRDRRLTNSRLYRWDAIAQISSQLLTTHGVTTLQIDIRLQDGKRLKLGRWPNLSRYAARAASPTPQLSLFQLLLAIKEASYPHRLAAASARLDTGERIAFGKLQLSQGGLHVKAATLPWWQVGDIDEREGILVIVPAGQQRPWRTVSLVNAPNADLLPALIARYQGQRFSAYQEVSPSHIAGTLRARVWRQRLVRWVLLPLLVIGVQAGIAHGSYLLGPRVHVDRGEAYFRDQNYTAALSEFDAALAKAAGDRDILIWRGQTYRELRRFDEALADYAAVLQVHPDDRLVLVLRGRVYYRQGRYQQALDEYNRVIAQEPRYYYAYCNRGYTYKMVGRNDKALDDFITCQNLATNDAWRREAAQQMQKLRAAPGGIDSTQDSDS